MMLSALDILGAGSRQVLITGLLMGGGLLLMGVLLSWRDKSALFRLVAAGLTIIVLTPAAVFLIPEGILCPAIFALALIYGGVMSLLAMKWHWQGASFESNASLGVRLFGLQGIRDMRVARWGISGVISIVIGIVILTVLVVKLVSGFPANGQ